jgi:aspartyl-tRNA(Asn)/glutamyl-tRNA(Gln) amidotransferase subunit A
MYRVDREGALAAGQGRPSALAREATAVALDGVPVTIKENIYTRGDPAPIGTRRTTTPRRSPRMRRPPRGCARPAA